MIKRVVEEFAADRFDEALGDRVRLWRPRWRLDDPDVNGREDRVEGGGELRDAVANEEPEALVGRGPLASCGKLADPGSVGWVMLEKQVPTRPAGSSARPRAGQAVAQLRQYPGTQSTLENLFQIMKNSRCDVTTPTPRNGQSDEGAARKPIPRGTDQ